MVVRDVSTKLMSLGRDREAAPTLRAEAYPGASRERGECIVVAVNALIVFQAIAKQRDQILKDLSALQTKKEDADTKKVQI